MIVRYTHHLLQILFAILVGYLLITRLFISWAQYAPDSFIETVEWATDSQIAFETIQIQQDWLGFQLQLKNLEVANTEYHLTVQDFDVDINVFSMLIPTMKFGEYLTIQKAVYQPEPPANKGSEKSLLGWNKQTLSDLDVADFTKINANISQLWQRVKASDVQINSILNSDINVHIYQYQSLKGIQLNVVSELGIAYQDSLNYERFGFKSTFDIDLLGHIAQGELTLFSFQPLRVEDIIQLLPKVWHQKLPDGELMLDLKAEVTQSQLSRLVLNLNGQALKWHQKKASLPQHVGLELVWALQDWQFTLSKIQLNNQYIKTVSPIELNFEKNHQLHFQAERFDIAPFKEVIQSLIDVSNVANFFNQSSGLAIEGVKGTFNWQTFKLPSLEMLIKELKLPASDYPGMELKQFHFSKQQQHLELKTEYPIILTGLNLPKGGVKITLPNEIHLQNTPAKGGWILTPLSFMLDQMPVVLSATANTQGEVDVNLSIKIGSIETLKQYMPYQLMGKKLQTWLNMALVSGENIQANVALKGNLKQFPFKDSEGVFKVSATVEQAVLNFDSDWPPLKNFTGQLEFTPYQLKITTPEVNVGAHIQAKAVEVLIQKMNTQNVALVFKGHVQTQLKQAMSYLTLSPLARLLNMEPFIESTQFDGQVDVNLERVWIPLAGYSGQKEKVSGKVVFKQSGMTLFDKIPLKKMQGVLAFSEQGIQASQLSAHVFDYPSTFSVKTHPKAHQIVIKGGGNFLTKPNPFFERPVPWDLAINIPFRDEKTSSIDIQLKSDLSKATSLLPEPFHQQALKGKPLQLQVRLAQESLSFQAHLPELLLLKSDWISDKKQYQLQQLNLLLGTVASDPEKNAFKSTKQSFVKGDLSSVNVDDWIRLFDKIPMEEMTQNTSPDLRWVPSSVDVNSLIFRGYAYPNVRIEWLKRNLRTALQIKSSDILANLVIKPNTPIEMNVERLRLHAVELTEESSEANPLCQPGQKAEVLWPEVIFKGKQIELNGYLIESLAFHLLDAKERLTITDMSGVFGGHAGQLTGQYLFDKAAYKSTLSLVLRSKKVSEVLRFMKLKQGFTGKKAKVNVALSWQGAMECFSKKAAEGTLYFVLENGSIEAIEPGIARLIGLLSVESLARRLQLNLKDVTNKGMVYDQIKGQATLNKGILQLDSMGLKAPSASVALFGQVNLLDETFKLKAYVTPAIGSTIPTIAALAGYSNPLAALAVYTVMKVLPGVNENLVTYRYNITGPWLSPNISELENKKKKSESAPLFEEEHSILDTQR